jgi:hypothetical protein
MLGSRGCKSIQGLLSSVLTRGIVRSSRITPPETAFSSKRRGGIVTGSFFVLDSTLARLNQRTCNLTFMRRRLAMIFVVLYSIQRNNKGYRIDQLK